MRVQRKERSNNKTIIEWTSNDGKCGEITILEQTTKERSFRISDKAFGLVAIVVGLVCNVVVGIAVGNNTFVSDRSLARKATLAIGSDRPESPAPELKQVKRMQKCN